MLKRILLSIVLVLAGGVSSLLAQPASPAIHHAIHSFIEDQEISGAVTLVARQGEIVHLESQGIADLETGRPLRTDDLFWIASMTKPITAVAVLMLQDEGRLSVHDPVEAYLPEFRNLWLVADKSAEHMQLKRPGRKITLHDLLTHTAGVPNINEPRPHSTLAELVALTSQQPLNFEPGSKWSYSNAGINTLGRVVEVVSGMTFDSFLDERLFHPLGMADTTFFPTRSQVKRMAKSYQKDAESGQLEPTSIYFVNGDYWDTRRTVKPAGGLFSTAEDMFRFYQMMLNGGEFEGNRYLSGEAVRALTKTQTGDIKTGFTDGMSWGLGFQVVKEPRGVTEMLTPGTFGHGGAYATQSWADPETRLIYILMIQRRGLPNGDQSNIRHAFQKAAATVFQF